MLRAIQDMLDFSASETAVWLNCAQCGGAIVMRSDGSVMMPKEERTQVLFTRIDGIPVLAFFCSQKCSDLAKEAQYN